MIHQLCFDIRPLYRRNPLTPTRDTNGAGAGHPSEVSYFTPVFNGAGAGTPPKYHNSLRCLVEFIMLNL